MTSRNVNDNGFPNNPNLSSDDMPSVNQSLNMYVETSNPVFAYQVLEELDQVLG